MNKLAPPLTSTFSAFVATLGKELGCPDPIYVHYRFDTDEWLLVAGVGDRRRGTVLTREMLIAADSSSAAVIAAVKKLINWHPFGGPALADPLCFYPPYGYEPEDWPEEPPWT